MRIVIDLQGAQGENRDRGIGKYSLQLALGLVRLREFHEIFIVLNGGLAQSIGNIRAAFTGLLPQSHILIWNAPMPVSSTGLDNDNRRLEAELLREAFLAALEPDWVLVTSHFEGQGDNAVTSVGAWRRLPTAVVLYDLIPWMHPDHYLVRDTTRTWYTSKLDSLKRADLLLSISASTRSEAIQHLGFEADDVVNISAAVEPHFAPQQPTEHDLKRLVEVFRINRPFIMYTGGIDYRKNIEGLIRSFAMLPDDVRARHQLIIVCYINDEWNKNLRRIFFEVGLDEKDVVLTGFVSDADMLLLYNACNLFVFPSWHEGFGLPVLEAMRCGKAVIASKLTSIPEIVGRNDALFDPFDLTEMTAMLERGLIDKDYRQSLAEHGLRRSRNFSWDETARRAWAALEHGYFKRSATVLLPKCRVRLAFVSPLPPERSGISNYSALLLQELTRWYEIDVVVIDPDGMSDAYVRATCRVISVEEFRSHFEMYDRVLYHFGNSEFHKHMFELLAEIPGVVVLHDFYLSSIQMWSEVLEIRFAAMARALLAERGYRAVVERFGLIGEKFDYNDYPASLTVIQDALAVIVHSEYSCKLAEEWYGKASRSKFSIIPHLHKPIEKNKNDKALARDKLGIAPDALVICAFGFVTEAKLPDRLIDSWAVSKLTQRGEAHCVFVGEAPGEYGEQLRTKLADHPQGNQFKITGWVDANEYRLWLDAADIAVQLRKNSRGETSGCIHDTMGIGLPTIVNAHGFAGELDQNAVLMISDDFADRDLAKALETLAADATRRSNIGDYARKMVHATQSSKLCSRMYYESIEGAYERSERDCFGIAEVIRRRKGGLSADFVSALALNNPLEPRRPKLFIDISSMSNQGLTPSGKRSKLQLLKDLLLSPPSGFNVEPVFASSADPIYRYARQFTLALLECPEGVGGDEVAIPCTGDVLICLECGPDVPIYREKFYQRLLNVGVPVFYLLDSGKGDTYMSARTGSLADGLRHLMQSGLPQIESEELIEKFDVLAVNTAKKLGWHNLV